jgi:short-subunit dehydrogenase
MGRPVALVTGASRGIGKALVMGLAQAEYDVVLCATSLDQISRQAECIESDCGVQAMTCALDVRDRSAVFSAVESVMSRFGRLDVLINNAGICGAGSGFNAPYSECVDQMNVNYFGALNVAQAVVPHMVAAQSGYIINMSSFSGKVAKPSRFSYAPSKFALTAMNEALFHELAGQGIKVTAICPRYVPTQMTENLAFSNDEKLQFSDLLDTVQYLLNLSPQAVIKEVHLDCRRVAAQRFG